MVYQVDWEAESQAKFLFLILWPLITVCAVSVSASVLLLVMRIQTEKEPSSVRQATLAGPEPKLRYTGPFWECYQIASPCARRTVRPINTKTLAFRTEKGLLQVHTKDGRLMPSHLKVTESFHQAPLKAEAKGGVWLVVADFLVSDPLLLRLGHSQVMMFLQISVILCPDKKGQRPKAQLSLSKVPVLVKRRQLLQEPVPTPCSAVIPEEARHPTQPSLSLLRPPKWRRPGLTNCNWGSQPLLLGHRERDGGEVHHPSKHRPRLEEGLSEGPEGLQDVVPSSLGPPVHPLAQGWVSWRAF